MPLEPQRYILLYDKYVDIVTISMIDMAEEFGDLVKVYIYIYWRIMLYLLEIVNPKDVFSPI